ncbi:MAG: guanylate kinase [Deltaproteobacteria bacterium]|nr:guanylate kinase [Deltaproteobacteria bacterium]
MSGGDNQKTEESRGSASGSKGNLFIISAPSGAGKTTLCKELLKHFKGIRFSISHTTRGPRPGETEGTDYFFTSEEDFQDGIKNNTWAEWAKVHGNYYGTSIDFLNDALSSGSDVILDIDFQGAMQILKKYPDVITIFIMPPSIEILRSRLQERGTESDEVIENRITNAKQEIQKKNLYNYIIINDKLTDSKEELFEIVNKHLHRKN